VEHRLVGLVRLIALLVRLLAGPRTGRGVERSRWVWAGPGALLGPEGTGESLVLLLRAIWGRANRLLLLLFGGTGVGRRRRDLGAPPVA
jgi:hypothetical protein